MIEIIRSDQFMKKERADIPKQVFDRVSTIVDSIQKDGFAAVAECTKRFDGFELTKENLKISEAEILQSDSTLTSEQKQAIDLAFERVEQVQKSIANTALQETKVTIGNGYVCFKPRPIERIGIYVPGGVAPLPSSLLMAGIPARIAGVKEIVVCTPPRKEGISPAILYIAKKLGIKEIYQIGGAQGIAAMAYGLPDLLPKVDMICGPGNVYVAAAKQLVSSQGLVKIDMVAGPSEVLVIADDRARADYIAADMLAQAEHGTTSSAILLTDSKELATNVRIELEKQFNQLTNKEIAGNSIRDYGAIVLVDSVDQAIEIANEYAPEHLEVFVRNPELITSKFTSAGALFINTCEAFADYGMGGGNHILPTGGTARFLSGLSVYDFIIRTYVEYMTDEEQAKLAEKTSVFADLEGLESHSKAAKLRGEQK
ncbi:histidinol dehydrogenase [Candidatus Micrarchaeota archaeon]|nr:histidinol dehydrogenase [Candidatus Micrarchaeota archaeon]